MGRSILEKMGCSNTRSTINNEPLSFCKERKKFVKEAMDSRCALAAAHISYLRSLRNIGVCLRHYAESESESESSPPLAELQQSPSPRFSDSPLSHIPNHNSSFIPNPNPNSHLNPNPNPNLNPNPNSFLIPNQNPNPNLSTLKLSYTKSAMTNSSVTFTINPLSDCDDEFVESAEEEEEEEAMPVRTGRLLTSSWDYFDDFDSFSFLGLKEESEIDRTSLEVTTMAVTELKKKQSCVVEDEEEDEEEDEIEREDPSEFITHRAKDFVSSIKDIEHRFFKASESGKEVSRMLETNKIRVQIQDLTGKGASSMAFLEAFKGVCCRGKSLSVSKVIIWKRTSSSSSSRNHQMIQENDENGSDFDFVEDFCMISGSHSSSLDRLYAWERKLFDEVKGSEILRKQYDKKCEQLRTQFAKDHSTKSMDKTRSIVKDLHSRIKVSIQSVDSISKRIEGIRDDELQPQLFEFLQGLIRMWKLMLECHHSQYITISLAYHCRNLSKTVSETAIKDRILRELLEETECFGLSFADFVKCMISYINALNGWLNHCVLHPQERLTRNRRPWSPRRVLAPPIFVVCRDWLAGVKSLKSDEVSNSIKEFSLDLKMLMDEKGEDSNTEKSRLVSGSSSTSLHSSLRKLLERLKKFSEASLKMYEDVKAKSEAARVAYTNSSKCGIVRGVLL